MNPLIKVSDSKIDITNQQDDIASANSCWVKDQIRLYISMCEKDVKPEKTPVKQHRIPEFLLRNFAGTVAGRANRIQVLRYQIGFNGQLNIQSLEDRTANSFSIIDNFYSIPELNNDYESTLKFGSNDIYRIEKLLGVIEGNVAPLVKLRQKESFYRKNSISNPYLYPEYVNRECSYTSSSMLETTTGRRVVLAVFFAAQYLRSSYMSKHFLHRKKEIQREDHPRYGKFLGDSFPDWISYMLPVTAELFYSRAWRWVHSSHEGFMSEGTSIVPLIPSPTLYSPATEHSLVMPLGRHATIFFKERDSFWQDHDGVFVSDSLGLSNWVTYKLIQGLAYDARMKQRTKDKIREVEICMHPEANLAHLFKTNQPPNTFLKKEMDRLFKIGQVRFREVNFLGQINRLREEG